MARRRRERDAQAIFGPLPALVILVWAGLVAGGACRPQSDGEAEPVDDSDTVVATMGEQAVRSGDIDRAIRRRALLEGVSPDEWVRPGTRRDPYLLYRMADSILQERRLLAEGARLGLRPSETELRRAWSDHPALSRLLVDHAEGEDQASATERLLALDLDVDDVHHLLETEIVHDRWLELVRARMPEERVWEEYRYRRDTVTVEAVGLANVPTADELAAFLASAESAEAIERRYAEHPERFTRPESVDARVVGAATRELAAALREEALAGADLEAMSRERSDHPAAGRGGLLEGLVERQLPEVFGQEVGIIGPLVGPERPGPGPGGWAFYRVEARHPPELRPLDDLLRREIAASLLARQSILSLAGRRAEALLAAMRTGDDEAVADVLDVEGQRSRVIGPVRREDDGLVSGIGRSETLQRALFALAEPGQFVERPVLVDGTVWLARLIERSTPTRADFEAAREDFEAELGQSIRATAWDAFWARELAETPIELVVDLDDQQAK